MEIQLTIKVNFISYEDDNDKEREIHSKSDNIEIMMNDEADEVIEEPFESLLTRYQNILEASIRGSDFILDYVQLLYYKYH